MSPTAERIPFGDAPPTRDVRKRVGRVLAGGGLVALPTETVYGIAARADDDSALRRLREQKGRGADGPFTWHVASRDVVRRFEHLRPLLVRLVERYWPGPLTLVLEGVPKGLEGVAGDGWTGVRLPAHRGTCGLLGTLPFPVVLSSVNLHGEQPLLDAADILRRFGEGLDLVLDGGSSRLGESSGVLRVGRGRFELLREGLLPIEDLRRTAGLRIGFCCTGNTCRSPMAEGIAGEFLADRLGGSPRRPELLGDFGFELSSMGLAAHGGESASRHAVDVLAERGIDISAHRTTRATLERIVGLDRVYCLTAGHRAGLAALLPPGKDRHVELLDPRGEDVADPIGGSRGEYERCAARILEAIEARVEDWA